MKITESKLKKIIRSVIQENMDDIHQMHQQDHSEEMESRSINIDEFCREVFMGKGDWESRLEQYIRDYGDLAVTDAFAECIRDLDKRNRENF